MRTSGPAWRLGWMAGCMLLAGCAGPSRGDLSIGRVVTPGNTQIPLPPGEWVLLAEARSNAGTSTGGGINNQHSAQVYYARLEKGRIVQVVFASSSEGAPSQYGYVTGAACHNSAPNDFVYYSDRGSGTFNAIDCVKVTGNRVFNRPGQASSDLYRQAFEQARELGGIPRHAVQVEIAQAHSLRYLDYVSYFFPDQSASTGSTDWRVGEMRPDHRTFVDGVIRWAKDFREAVRLGTDYRL